MQPIYISNVNGNLFAFISEAVAATASKGRTWNKETYSEFRSELFFGSAPAQHTINRFLGEIHVALTKPIDRMSIEECEAEWEFVHGEKRGFTSVAHARSAIQALVDKGSLMTSYQYDTMLEHLPFTKKPITIEPTAPVGFLDGIKHEAPAAPVEDDHGEGRLTMVDMRDIKGRIAGKYTKRAVAARKAAAGEGTITGRITTNKPNFEEVTPVLSGVQIEFKADIGKGDKISNMMADGTGVDKIITDNGLKIEDFQAPNPGVKKMRVMNKLRSLLKKGTEVHIHGVTIKLAAE